MYKAYHNGELFFDSSSDMLELALIKADVTMELNGAGSFVFTLAQNNVAFGQFRSLASKVDVYRDNEIIFSGRVIIPSNDLYVVETITCEGMYSVLNDTVYRPTPQPFNGQLSDLVELLLASHNSQVEADKQIQIRNLTVTDEYMFRAYENIGSTMGRLEDLRDSYGGYMSVSKNAGQLWFDWIADIEETSAQRIALGENLLNIQQESSGADVITVLIPLGAEIEDENGVKKRIDITSVNGGLDYLESTTGISNYGRIVRTQIWDDVTQPSILRQKGIEYLSQTAKQQTTISLSALDLADIGEQVNHFSVGERIYVESAPHGVADFFTCTQQGLNLLDPAQNTLTLGASVLGYIENRQKVANQQAQIIDHINSTYASNLDVSELERLVSEHSTGIEQNSEYIRSYAELIETLRDQINKQSTELIQTANSIAALVKENDELKTFLEIRSDGVYIGKGGEAVQSRQTATSYQFIDSYGNILLEINTEGMTTPTVNATSQVAFLSGSTPQWAIRKGEEINDRYNLNDVWIGG